MQPFDKPPPRRTAWDQIAYGLCVLLIWVAALISLLAG